MPTKSRNEHGRFGNYRLMTELNTNTESHIFLGERRISDEPGEMVAIKWLYSTHLLTQQDRRNFLQEVHQLKQLEHPYILPLLSAGFDEDTPYLVMQYAPNQSLSERLQHRQPLPHEEAIHILNQIGRALHYAHRWNITHGNLKPQNILFSVDQEALLTDFVLTSLPSPVARTVSPLAEASIYTAPEQLTGRGSPQGDIYALGCIAYEMFTGYKPFLTPSPTRPGVIYRTTAPVAPRELNSALPQHIEEAILQTLLKKPEQRLSDIPTFLAALKVPSTTKEAKEVKTPLIQLQFRSPIKAVTQQQMTTEKQRIASSAAPPSLENVVLANATTLANPGAPTEKAVPLLEKAEPTGTGLDLLKATYTLLPIIVKSALARIRNAIFILLLYLKRYSIPAMTNSKLPATISRKNRWLTYINTLPATASKMSSSWFYRIKRIVRERRVVASKKVLGLVVCTLLLVSFAALLLTYLQFLAPTLPAKSLTPIRHIFILVHLQPGKTPTSISTVKSRSQSTANSSTTHYATTTGIGKNTPDKTLNVPPSDQPTAQQAVQQPDQQATQPPAQQAVQQATQPPAQQAVQQAAQPPKQQATQPPKQQATQPPKQQPREASPAPDRDSSPQHRGFRGR